MHSPTYVLWLVACGDPATVPIDEDRDGAAVGIDCDDDDPGVSPLLPETAYNGTDDDCDPATPDDDLDGDGARLAIDCDDGDAAVSPAAIEVRDNGKDDDCDPATPDVECRVLQGSYEVASALDVTQLSGFCEITGNLEISAPGLLSAELSDLVRIGGDLIVRGNDGIAIELTALVEVVGALGVRENAGGVVLALPVLGSVGAIEVEDDIDAVELYADALPHVPALVLRDHDGTMIASFGALATADTVALRDVSGGLDLRVPALVRVTTLEVEDTFTAPPFVALASVETATLARSWLEPATQWTLPALVEVGTLDLRQVRDPVGGSDLLNLEVRVDLPVLVSADRISFDERYLQVELSAPALETLGTLDAVVSRLGAIELPVLREADVLRLEGQVPDPLVAISLPALEVVHGYLHALSGVSAPLLALVEGDPPPPGYPSDATVYVHTCIGGPVDLSSLTSVADGTSVDLFFENDCAPGATSVVDLSALQDASDLYLGTTYLVEAEGVELRAPSLTEAGELGLYGILDTSDLSALQTVSGALALWPIGDFEVPSLGSVGALAIGGWGSQAERVAFPVLTEITGAASAAGGWELSVRFNDALRTVELPALTLIEGDVLFDDNPVWCESAARALLAGVPTVTGAVQVEADGTDPGC